MNKNTHRETFSVAEAASTGRLSRWIPWDQMLIFFAAVVVLFFRMPERLLHGYLWAEDVTVFVSQGFKLGAQAVITPYAGYLHVIPRLAVYIYQLFGGIYHVPFALAWFCALITGAICAYTYSIGIRYLPKVAAVTVALAPVLIPHVSESWLNITNLQWTTGPLLLAMLLDAMVREDDDHLVGRCIVILLISLTGTFSTIFAPIAIAGIIVVRRTKPGWKTKAAPFVVSLAAGCMQVAIFKFANDRHVTHGIREYLNYFWAHSFFKNLVMDSLLPFQVIDTFGDHWKPVAAAMALVVLACALSPKGRWRVFNAILLWATIVLWILGVIRTDAPQVDVQWFAPGVARYTFMPLLFGIWMLTVAAVKSHYKIARYSSMALLVLLIANGATRFYSPSTLPVITEKADGSYLIQAAPGGPWHATVMPR